MEFWTEFAQTLPDWTATLVFFVLGILLFISFVTNTSESGFTQKMIWLVAAAAIYLYWFRDQG